MQTQSQAPARVPQAAAPRPRTSRPGLAPALAALLALAAAPPATSPLAAQQFGGVAAVAGDQVLIGEPANQTLPGIVYVYEHDGSAWAEAGRLAISELGAAPDGFGRSISADGDLVVIGAPEWDGSRGAAIVYRRGAGGEWTETARLEPTGASAGSRAGTAVALEGDVILVSAPAEEEGEGSVAAFVNEGDGWVERTAFGPESAIGFGSAIALADGIALIGSRATRETPAAVYAVTVDPSAPALATGPQQLDHGADLGERPGFGAALAVDGSTAFVGAPGAFGTGAVATFEMDSGDGTWTEGTLLRPFQSDGPQQFGASLHADQGDVWVGAPGAGGRAGAVYRFSPGRDGGWGSVTRASHADLPAAASYGSTLAVADDVAVVGAGGIDSRAGGAVLMARGADGEWSGGELVIGDHRGLPAIVGLEDEIACEENAAAGYECDNVNIVSFLPIKDLAGGRGARLNDIWGWTDPETGREIAIVGRTDGTAFVDLTDPYNPIMLGDLPKTPGSRSSVWRDMKVHRDHTYIVADGAGEHGVQVFDLRRLRDVGGDPVTFEPDFLYDGIHSAHNIVINEETGFAYVVGSSGGGETCGGGLHMLDLDAPAEPTFAGCFFDSTTGRRGTGYSHDAQCVIYNGPDEDYVGREICLGSNETALSISDVTDKDNPVAIASQNYPAVAYAHQGWLTEDHAYFYMNDEGDEPQGLVDGTRTLIWDVQDLDEPVLAAEYIAETPDTDHNLYILGNLMYQSNYGAGLRVLDITNRTEPEEIAFFDNSPYGGASWSNYPYFKSGVVVMTSTGDGLFIVRNTARAELIP